MNVLFQLNALTGFNQLMQRIEGRLAADAYFIKESSKFLKKASVQIGQFPDHFATNESQAINEEQTLVTSELEHKGVNLLSLGEMNDSEKCLRVARQPCEPEELRSYVIDPRRTANIREKTDPERTELSKKTVRALRGVRYSEVCYSYSLSLINQICLNMKDQAEEEKENSQEFPGTNDQVVELAKNEENNGLVILKGHNSKSKSNRFSHLQETKLPPPQYGRRETEK